MTNPKTIYVIKLNKRIRKFQILHCDILKKGHSSMFVKDKSFITIYGDKIHREYLAYSLSYCISDMDLFEKGELGWCWEHEIDSYKEKLEKEINRLHKNSLDSLKIKS